MIRLSTHDPLFLTLESKTYEYPQLCCWKEVAYLIDSGAVGLIERYIMYCPSQIAIISITQLEYAGQI